MKKIVVLFCCLVSLHAKAQHEADNWYFGSGAGISFSTPIPTVITGGQINTQEGCSSISDANGNLLFYSDGITVWDHNHAILPNGTGLWGHPSSTMSCMFVAMPGSSSLFYLFTAPVTASNTPFAYSIIDLTLNGGFGAVTVKNDSLWASSMEKVTAVRHQNQNDIWIIGHESNNHNFFAFLLTSSGISASPVLSTVFTLPTITIGDDMGQMKASPCGTHLAVTYHQSAYAAVFDFDDATGVVSNAVLLGQYSGLANYTSGIEFSPDNSKVYATGFSNDFLMQYDLNAASIAASADTIATSTGTSFMMLQTGPDGKIYLAIYNSDHLACITSPNDSGSACNFVLNYITFPSAIVKVGLPCFPSHYFCELNTSVANSVQANTVITLYPNPAKDVLHVAISSNTTGSISVSVMNALGQEVYSAAESIMNPSSEISIPLQNIQNGIYFLKTKSKEGIQVTKFLVE